MNVELLRKVRAHIRRVPMSFVMDDWASPAETPCRTVACIAGHAYRLEHPTAFRRWLGAYWHRRTSGIADGAQRALRLDNEQADRLFLLDYWPKKFYEGWYWAETPAERAKVAAARITHFIRTKGE
jgi:hypothetical protein